MKSTLIFRLSVFASLLFLLGMKAVDKPTIFTSKTVVCSECKEIVEPSRLNQAIHLAANYLLKVCDENGKFTYRINLNPKVRVKPSYNMVRHAGVMYALAMYEQEYPNAKTRETLVRAAQFLKKTIAPLAGKEDLLAVWSDPKVIGGKAPVQAKLGGTALGLVALASLEQIKPGTTSIDYLRKMANFIVFMQKDDGGFYSKYIPSRGGVNKKWVSLYYPGEATLGLSLLYKLDPNPVWMKTATNALAYLARLRANKTTVEADHWALLATAKWMPLHDKSFLKPVIWQHAIQIVESMLLTRAKFPKNSMKHGGFIRDGRTTPTATRLEGLLAAMTILAPEEPLLQRCITYAVTHGLSFLLRAQVHSGEHKGAMPQAIPANSSRNNLSNKKATEVRIDYVQHALSAMLQFEQIFYKTNNR